MVINIDLINGKNIFMKNEIQFPNEELINKLKENPDVIDEVYKHYNDYFVSSDTHMVSSPSNLLINEELKKKNLMENIVKVFNHNVDATKPYKIEINKYSYLNDDDFIKYFNIHPIVRDPQAECSATSKKKLRSEGKVPPSSVDWRNSGIVTPVKNQGHCGSCWTFSSTGAIEAHVKKTTGVSLDLSEQQLIDCARNYDNHGCNGGLPSHAFEYIKASGGIEAESSYPYKAADEPGCNFEKGKVAAEVVSAFNITQGDEKELKKAVAFAGPVSITFQVVGDFRSYSSGVYVSNSCGNRPEDVNHAVLAVGYGHDDASGKDYWIVKNSWGPAWGDQGYFKIERGVNMCGVAVCNSYPIVKGEKIDIEEDDDEKEEEKEVKIAIE